jgi:hypothetical protein
VKTGASAGIPEAAESRLLLPGLLKLVGILPLVAVFIVFLAVFLAGEDLVGLVDFLEFGL